MLTYKRGQYLTILDTYSKISRIVVLRRDYTQGDEILYSVFPVDFEPGVTLTMIPMLEQGFNII